MRYVSVCSGIEAASVAWHPLGWECAAVSEIEAFPSAVLAHHYPTVPNLGDLTRYADWPDLGPVDLLVGGTPCQSFSVAGLRQGLADPRGNLALVFLGLLDRLRPRWVVWENVPGVLSSSGGRDFGSFLGGLAELGYGWAYRVLDAQYFGVAQRRRRVFVVGYLGDWRPPVAVLFEPESLRGDTPPRREAGERVAPTLASRLRGGGGLGTDCELDGGVMAFAENQRGELRTDDIAQALSSGGGKPGQGYPAVFGPASTLNAAGQMHVAETVGALCADSHPGAYSGQDAYTGRLIAHAMRESGPGFWTEDTVAGPLRAEGENRPSRPSNVVTHALTGTGHDASEDGLRFRFTCLPCGTRFGVNDYETNWVKCPKCGETSIEGIVDELERAAYPLDLRNAGRDPEDTRQGSGCNTADGDPSPTLTKAFVPGVAAFGWQNSASQGDSFSEHITPSLDKSKVPAVYEAAMQVRRLTPTECARLQGFPDDYLDITYRGKPAADGPKYKALGNSMAVPVMSWIGERIAMVDALTEEAP